MTEAAAPQVCEGCEFGGTEASAWWDTASVIAITPEGEVRYSGTDYADCGLAFGRVPAEDAWSGRPELAEKIEACTGPRSEIVDVPVKWPLGWLGFTKQAELNRCGALEAADVDQIIRANITACRGAA